MLRRLPPAMPRFMARWNVPTRTLVLERELVAVMRPEVEEKELKFVEVGLGSVSYASALQSAFPGCNVEEVVLEDQFEGEMKRFGEDKVFGAVISCVGPLGRGYPRTAVDVAYRRDEELPIGVLELLHKRSEAELVEVFGDLGNVAGVGVGEILARAVVQWRGWGRFRRRFVSSMELRFVLETALDSFSLYCSSPLPKERWKRVRRVAGKSERKMGGLVREGRRRNESKEEESGVRVEVGGEEGVRVVKRERGGNGDDVDAMDHVVLVDKGGNGIVGVDEDENGKLEEWREWIRPKALVWGDKKSIREKWVKKLEGEKPFHPLLLRRAFASLWFGGCCDASKLSHATTSLTNSITHGGTLAIITSYSHHLPPILSSLPSHFTPITPPQGVRMEKRRSGGGGGKEERMGQVRGASHRLFAFLNTNNNKEGEEGREEE